MRIRYRTWAWALAIFVFAVPAMADEREGPYVFITGGAGIEQNACNSPWIVAGTPCNDKSAVFRAGVGYQYSPMWALELNYGQFGDAVSAGWATFAGGPGLAAWSWELKATGLAVQGVATVHMTDEFAVFGKFGVAAVKYDESMRLASPTTGYWTGTPTASTTRYNPALGAGIRLDVTEHGTVLFLVESFGQNNIYGMYGVGSKVRLVTGSVGLMWRW